MLTHEGFRAGATEELTGPGTSGLSVVEQFRSTAAARAALDFYLSRLKAPGSSAGADVSCNVSRIPGAVAFSLGGAGGGINIAFARGDFYYLIGQGGGGAAAISGLDVAARHLYDRVSG